MIHTQNIQPEYTDARGGITKVLDDGKTAIRSILLITSKPGSIRANHYHKTDAHYCYLISGSMEYFEKPVEGGELTKVIVKAGDVIFTSPMIMHAMRFLEDTTFFAFALNSRSQAEYEADTVRVNLI